MKQVKKHTCQNCPIKLNYNSNDLLYSYKGSGKPTCVQKFINVNKKRKNEEENKSFSSLSKNTQNTSYIFINKNPRNKNSKKDSNSSLINSSNQNIKYQSYVNNKKFYTNNHYSYKNLINDSYSSNNYWRENSNITKYNFNNSIINNEQTYNNMNNSIFSYVRTNIHDKSLFNKRQIYQKQKKERSSFSYSFAITDYNSNKSTDNINIKSNINTESNNKNMIYFNKCNNCSFQGVNNMPRSTSFTGLNTKNYICYNVRKINKSFWEERKTNNECPRYNIYYPKENQNNHIENYKKIYMKRSHIKSDIIKNEVYETNDNLSFLREKNYKTFNFSGGVDKINNQSFIYVRKNSSNKQLINKNKNNYSFKNNNNINIINNKANINKIRVNLKKNRNCENRNTYGNQKKIILIQKNYRMHLSRLKRYILKAIKDIVEASNKLYYIFYKYYFKKLIHTLKISYIKNFNVNTRSAKVIPRFNDKLILNCKNNNNNSSRPKFYYIINQPEKFKKLDSKNKFETKPKIINSKVIIMNYYTKKLKKSYIKLNGYT